MSDEQPCDEKRLAAFAEAARDRGVCWPPVPGRLPSPGELLWLVGEIRRLRGHIQRLTWWCKAIQRLTWWCKATERLAGPDVEGHVFERLDNVLKELGA